MVGLTNLELCNSIFNITEEKNKFKPYTDNFDKFSLKELKDELGDEIFSISDTHHLIYNMKEQDPVLVKPIRN